MHSKRMAAIFVLLLMLGGVALANGDQIAFDTSKALYHLWIEPVTDEVYDLKCAKSIDQGYIFNQPQALYSFTREATRFDVWIDNNRYFLSFSDGNNLYLTSSTNFGRTFSPPLLVSEKAGGHSLAIRGDSVLLAWEAEGTIKVATLESKTGPAFSDPAILTVTGEALSSPKLIALDEVKICFLSSDPKTGLRKIIYSSLDGSDPEIVYQGLDELANLKVQTSADGLIFLWSKPYFGWVETYRRTYFAKGGFGKAHSIPTDIAPLALILRQENPLLAATGEAGLSLKEIYSTPPTPPRIIPSGTRQLMIENAAGEPLLAQIDLSPNESFGAYPAASYFRFCTQESNIVELPADLDDGTYYLRASVSDGLFASRISDPIEFKIDTLAPEIITLDSRQSMGKVTFQGKISEAAAFFSINGLPVSFESDTQFISTADLAAEENLFTFILSDEAGNTNTITEEVIYNAASPEIAVINPKPTDWFKPGSTILIDAAVFDLQEDIEDWAEAGVTINGQPLDDLLGYAAEERSLFGFITLPEDILDGAHAAAISLADQAGNIGGANFSINIDSAPPVYTGNNEHYACSSGAINIPITDKGAGVDPGGTIIKIKGNSFEGEVSVEAQSIVLVPVVPLIEGSYEVEVYPRDMIGNTGEAISFRLVIDNSFKPNEARPAALSGLISSCTHGPNPFSPTQKLTGAYSTHGNGMVFSYSLAHPADVKIMIYDITGTLIWVREVQNSASGVTAWNGVDQFGQMVGNGIYPYLFVAKSGGKTDTRRSKIIVYHQ